MYKKQVIISASKDELKHSTYCLIKIVNITIIVIITAKYQYQQGKQKLIQLTGANQIQIL